MMLFKWIHITFKEAKVPISSNNFNIDTFQKLQRFNEKIFILNCLALWNI